MFDNKRLGKKITTFLWIFATIIPLIVCVYYFVRMCLIGNTQGLTNVESILELKESVFNYEWTSLNNFITSFNNFMPTWLTTSTNRITEVLTNTLQTQNDFDVLIQIVFGTQIAWAIYIQIIHIVYDLLTVLFKLVHNFFGKLDA